VFGPGASQKDIYDEAIVPIVDEARALPHHERIYTLFRRSLP
jgi:hypothetical protein